MRFAGEFVDDALGADRLRGAYADAGLAQVTLALEPEAAGALFARTLTEPATVLIGDFGGGTSDFSVMRFDPRAGTTPLGHAGIGIAGDVFDYRIIDRAIAPLLGKGDTYRIMGKPLPVPPEYYSGFARWHRLSLMRTPRTLRAIAEVARTAQHPERLHHLIALIEDGLGYALYQAVSTAKAELSSAETTMLRFRHKDFVVERPLTRTEFEELDRPRPRPPRRHSRSGAGPGRRAGGAGGPRVPHRRHRLRPRRPPPVRNPLRRRQAGRWRRVRLGGRRARWAEACADRPARLVSRPHRSQEPPWRPSARSPSSSPTPRGGT